MDNPFIDLGILNYNSKKLRKKLMNFKALFKVALEKNTIQDFDEVLEKASKLTFQILEHKLCKEKRDKLVEQQKNAAKEQTAEKNVNKFIEK